MDEQKVKNLFNALTNDQKSIFYASDRITKGLIKKPGHLFIQKIKFL